MRYTLFISLILSSTFSFSQSWKKLHYKAVVVDTHNDVLINILEGQPLDSDGTGKSHSDIARFKKGGVDVQVFSIWSDERYGAGKGFLYANRQIDSLYAVTGRNSDRLMIVKTPAQLKDAVRQKKLGVMMGMEGGHMMEDNLGYLQQLFDRGVRYMTLTWNNSTSWASSAADEYGGLPTGQKAGLNNLGESVVRKMNELGMLVDVSHIGEQTFWDVMHITTKPVIASHSCVYNICPVPRNLKDDQIKAIAKGGGVVHLNFYSGFLDSSYNRRKKAFTTKHTTEIDSLTKAGRISFETDVYLAKKYPQEAEQLRAPLSLLLDHIDYIVKLVGVDHVGLGSDFDGIDSPPQRLDDVTNFPLITKGLRERGYSKKEVRKILGENFLRVFSAQGL